ncbi:MAG: hypothetical protein ACT4TC_26765 [Myxococcaceae bacterium]
MNESSENNARKPVSMQEAMFLRKLVASPSSRILANATLPKIPAPSLEGLSFNLRPIEGPTPDAVFARYEELCLEHAPRRGREAGEVLFEGDEVLLDVAAFFDGELIPFSVKYGARLMLLPGEFLPGFCEALWGHMVGAHLSFRITLPSDFPVTVLAGKDVSYAVTVRAATELGEFDIDDEEFVKSLGRGESLDAVMQSLAEDLLQETIAQCRLELVDEAMKALISRSQISVPEQLIDVEIGSRWKKLEGAYLESIDATAGEREASLAIWLDEPNVREDAKLRLAAQQVASALAEAHEKELRFGGAQVMSYADAVAKNAGLTRAELKSALTDDDVPDTTQMPVASQLVNQAIYFEVMDFVLSKAKLLDT